MLGIRSMMATPLFSDVRVVGLLEVFSPKAQAFTKIHEIVLEKLAELVPAPPPPQEPPPEQKLDWHDPSADREQSSTVETQTPEPANGVRMRRFPLGLIVASVALGALALGYVLAPTIEKHWFAKPEAAVQAASPDPSTPSVSKSRVPMSLPELRKMAGQGDPDAQWTLGGRYHDGDGVPQDDTVAVQWFLRAAEQGHVIAQATLGAYYWAGRGVPQDLSKAYFWSALAWARGDEGSKSRLEGLASQMTRTQVTTARQQAEEWIRQHTQKSKQN
jgi:TPR repeat protein